MTGSFWWDLLIGVAAALLLAWLVLVAALLVARPRGGLLREALRLLPDVLRLIRRLAADKTLPRGVRVRLGVLPAYLALPIDLVPDFIPVLGYARRCHHRHRRPARPADRGPDTPRQRSLPNYPEGRVTGLIRTTVCAEGGDSGGPLSTRDGSAIGITSGGSGDCRTVGVTFFQPVTTALLALGAGLGG